MDRYPQRIVCLTEETVETLYLLGAQDRIVGISGFAQRPKEAKRDKPIVSAFTTADIHKIEAVRPDLVLAFSDLQADIVRELVARGHNVVVFNQRSVDEILRSIVMLGALVGQGRAAEELVESYQARIDATRARASRLPLHPRVYFEEWPDPIITGIAWVSELIEIAGGIDVFSELRQRALAKDRIVTGDAVIARAPDVIVASWCGKMVKPDKIIAREGFEALDAIRARRIHEIKSTIILQPGPACLTDGLDALEHIIASTARSLGAA